MRCMYVPVSFGTKSLSASPEDNRRFRLRPGFPNLRPSRILSAGPSEFAMVHWKVMRFSLPVLHGQLVRMLE